MSHGSTLVVLMLLSGCTVAVQADCGDGEMHALLFMWVQVFAQGAPLQSTAREVDAADGRTEGDSAEGNFLSVSEESEKSFYDVWGDV